MSFLWGSLVQSYKDEDEGVESKEWSYKVHQFINQVGTESIVIEESIPDSIDTNGFSQLDSQAHYPKIQRGQPFQRIDDIDCTNNIDSATEDVDSIDTNDSFFKDEHIILRVESDESNSLELWRGTGTHLLLCSITAKTIEAVGNLPKEIFIVSKAGTLPREIRRGLEIALRMPFHVFVHKGKTGIIAPNISLA